MSEQDLPGSWSESQEKEREHVKEPDMYWVVLHNDDYTTMEFVVEILMKIFSKPVIDATRIMMDVHKKGRGVVGSYTYDIAATKVGQVRKLAQQREFPLKCTLERM